MRDKTPNLVKTKYGNFYSKDDPGEPFLNEPRHSVTEGEVKILKVLCKKKSVLEVGTGLGVSTRAIAEVATRVVSVDIDPWAHQFTFPDNVELLNSIPEEHFDVAFVDGSHTFEAVVADMGKADADKYILHDCYLPGVAKAIKFLALKEVIKFHTRCDMRMFLK